MKLPDESKSSLGVSTLAKYRLRAVSFCSSESVKETQKSSGELEMWATQQETANQEDWGHNLPSKQSLTNSLAASPFDYCVSMSDSKEQKEPARSLYQIELKFGIFSHVSYV